MKNRPYFSSSAAEIKDAVEKESNNPDALRELIKEIGFRKKGKLSLASTLVKAKQHLEENKSGSSVSNSAEQEPSSKIEVGDEFQDLILEIFLDAETNRIRVRPIEPEFSEFKVEFPKNLREEYPLGTRFKASVKASQKNVKSRPHLVASPNSIELVGGKISASNTDSNPKKPNKKEVKPALNVTELNGKGDDEPPEETPKGKQSSHYKVPLGKMGSIRKPSNSLKGLPNVWSPEEKRADVIGLEDAETNPQKYIAALGGLVWEIRRGAKFSKTINLTNGRKEKTHSGEYGYIYAFLYEGDEEFFEGARIDFQTGTKKTKGSIVSIFSGNPRKIVVSLDEDFGKTIKHCSITQDEAALLEALQKRFEIELGVAEKKSGSPVGMNTELADMLLEGESEELETSEYGAANTSGLNNDQKSFVEKAIKHSISVLWGPPGTGKTQTLGSLIDYFYSKGERTLICSNTNQAVDQVLLKLCKQLLAQGKKEDLEDGKIVRLGRISQTELLEGFSEYITIDGIAERKGAELAATIRELETKKSKHEVMLTKYQKIIQDSEELDALNLEFKEKDSEVGSLQRKIDDLVSTKKADEIKISSLEQELQDYQKKGFLGKALSRNTDKINADKRTAEQHLKATENKIHDLQEKVKSASSENKNLETQILKLERKLRDVNVSETKRLAEIEDETISEINAELSELKKQIEEIRKTILSNANVIGATLTKSFLSPTELGKFTNVVIDEASMGLIPSVYFTASQSELRCIISGDFRQLPPIVQSNNQNILDVVGGNEGDIFKKSGFEEDFENHVKCDYAEVLRLQYRMDQKICNLISKIGYAGELKTAPDRNSNKLKSPKKLADNVIIIDTSSLYPFTDRDPYGSTSNLLHALISRNLLREFNKLEGSGSVGYCAPYKAQTKLLKRMVEGEKFEENIAIGTVHTFQGDEKDTIIFDTVNSVGEKHFIFPSMAQEHAAKSNILTVAVSRAKERLIFIANLRYFDEKIPAMGYLRNILFGAQSTGTVLDAKEIIDLVPLKEELEKAKINIKEIKITQKALKSGLINEDSFFQLLKNDILKARKYIAIYSGFYTANRINDLSALFSQKIAKGVKIRAIIPPPNRNGSMAEADSTLVYESLEDLGVIVEFRARIHQKAVLIDDNIAWFGSLNPLSFSGGTEESMLRTEQKGITGTFAANMAVNRNSAKDDPELIAEQEIPNCSSCGGKNIFNRGRHGVWFSCHKCGSRENPKNF